MLEEIERLANFPNLGFVEILLAEEEVLMRSLIIETGKYKVIYFIEENCITITDIWDCRQNPGKLKTRTRYPDSL